MSADIPHEVQVVAMNAAASIREMTVHNVMPRADVERIIAAAIMAERERCAKLCTEIRDGNMMLDNEPHQYVWGYENACSELADLIRGGRA